MGDDVPGAPGWWDAWAAVLAGWALWPRWDPSAAKPISSSKTPVSAAASALCRVRKR